MIGDFTVLEQTSAQGARGTRTYNVSSSTAVFLAGEPVVRILGTNTATWGAATFGTVGTDYIAGIVETGTTVEAGETYPVGATGVGTIGVIPLSSGTTYLANPTVAATFATQAAYNVLVGTNVLITSTAATVNGIVGTTYTVGVSAGTTNSTYGVVIMPLDVSKYPGKVAVAFRAGLSDMV